MNKAVSFTTRRSDGDVRAPGALVKLLKRKRWPTAVATARQVHGTRIAIVPRLKRPKRYPATDGLLTDQPGVPLAIFTADCLPLFLADSRGVAVGALHAGWRGVRSQILRTAVRLFLQKWRIPPRRLKVWMGPHIGACCFEVRWDVARHFPRARRRYRDRWKVDLKAELRRQARHLGLMFLRRKSLSGCTAHEGRYFSYRRDQTDKRLASAIMKKDNPRGGRPASF